MTIPSAAAVPAKHSPMMGLWSVTALGIGAMVGAGIFALLGQAALLAGSDTYIAFLMGGFVAALSGYSYAMLAIRYPDAGGISTYFDHAFGPRRLSGTLSLIYLITIAVTIALVAKAFGAYATSLVVGTTSRLWVDIFASCLIIVMTLLNVTGSGLVGKAEIALVGIKLIILAGLMIAGAVGLAGRPTVEHLHPGVLGIVGSVGLTFLAYAGYGMMANAAGSVPFPKRTIPRAIYLAIGAVIVLYVGLAIVVLASVSPAQLAEHSDVAVAEAARPVLGQAGFVIVSVGALLATASGVNAWLFSAMQMSTALAKVGQLPKMFGRVFWRNGTRGLLFSVVGVLVFVNVFDLSALARIASATFLFTYLAVHVAHWRLIHETNGRRWIVAIGFITMAAVLGSFLWTMAIAAPWSGAIIVIFIVGSWVSEMVVLRRAKNSSAAKTS